ncbi:hypothetical protein KFU88_20730 [Escherichia coli]|uniref:hypothetical protein n=1 Tax=Escherichia coli TaxID=562 RepID=UPI00211E96DD|nr:hypothetical protein [Escherichia coli]UUP65548.1 hypothetical protein KFU88_20730 [Escherichia coli]
MLDSLSVLPDSDRKLRKLYNSFVLLAYLMNKICGENHWAEKLTKLIEHHAIDTNKMGFPANWKTKPIGDAANLLI